MNSITIVILILILFTFLLCIFYKYILNSKKEDPYKKIIKLIESEKNIFVTGGAGTGKSYILNKLRKQYPYLAITSTTGISALNIDGQTIHSWSGIGIANKTVAQTVSYIKNKKKETYKRILFARMLAIDEISMLDNKTFDYLNEVLKQVRQSSEPFGGIQVLLFGDFFQLPPVKLGVDGINYCFKSKAWNELSIHSVILKEVKRQTEKEFINALNNIRLGVKNADDSKLFFAREEESKKCATDETLHIFGTNQEADLYNESCFSALDGEVKNYLSTDVLFKYDFQDISKEIILNNTSIAALDAYDKKMYEVFNDDCKTPRELTLKINSRVMLLKNLNVSGGLVNGICGKVVRFSNDTIKVQFDNGKIEDIKQEEFILQKDSLPRIKRIQFPLRLAYGITIHKSQGMTFDKLVVNLQRVFAAGQAYVALSRTRTLEGLILQNYAPGVISVDYEVVNFYRKLEHKKPLKVEQKNIHSSVNPVYPIVEKSQIADNDDACVVLNEDINTAIEDAEESKNPPIYNTNFIIGDNKEEFEQNQNSKNSKMLTIKIAIANKNKLEVVYTNKQQEVSNRIIIPFELFTNPDDNETLYLRAFCILRNEERYFRVDRIQEVKLI